MQQFTIIELSTMLTAVLASLAMLCAAVQRSKCKRVKVGCIECERDQKAIEMDIENRDKNKDNPARP